MVIVSNLKWYLFALAFIFSCLSADTMHTNSAGGAAAGMWVAFALLHVQDRREALERKRP